MRQRRKKAKQKVPGQLSEPRHGISKQAVMSPLYFLNHVPCYRTVSKHYLHRIARILRDLCKSYYSPAGALCQTERGGNDTEIKKLYQTETVS